jgi:hypothetical protein
MSTDAINDLSTTCCNRSEPSYSRLLVFSQKAKMSLNPRTPGHTHTTSRLSTVPTSASKTRQLSHLHAQLAQLTANMSDMENLLRMTAVQAEGMRGLGGYAGGM